MELNILNLTRSANSETTTANRIVEKVKKVTRKFTVSAILIGAGIVQASPTNVKMPVNNLEHQIEVTQTKLNVSIYPERGQTVKNKGLALQVSEFATLSNPVQIDLREIVQTNTPLSIQGILIETEVENVEEMGIQKANFQPVQPKKFLWCLIGCIISLSALAYLVDRRPKRKVPRAREHIDR